MVNPGNFPNHLARTYRQWKVRKRREMRLIRRAVEEFRLGCAYTPAYDLTPNGKEVIFEQFDRMLKDMESRMSVKTWGR